MEIKPSDTTRRLDRPLPVTVIVPHQLHREKWFKENCLPSIKAQNPCQLAIVDGPGTAAEKRNEGARSAVQPYLYFCDDDVILRSDCLRTLFDAAEADPGPDFFYSSSVCRIHDGLSFPGQRGVNRPGPWDPEKLREANYINMMALVRREKFPGLDPRIRRFEDWDLWLTISENGGYGKYVSDVLFESHHFDKGVTLTEPEEFWLREVKKKHGMKVEP